MTKHTRTGFSMKLLPGWTAHMDCTNPLPVLCDDCAQSARGGHPVSTPPGFVVRAEMNIGHSCNHYKQCRQHFNHVQTRRYTRARHRFVSQFLDATGMYVAMGTRLVAHQGDTYAHAHAHHRSALASGIPTICGCRRATNARPSWQNQASGARHQSHPLANTCQHLHQMRHEPVRRPR